MAATLLTLLLAQATDAVAQGWYNSSWLYRKKITIDRTKVGSTGAPHVNFPVLVSLASDANLSSNARADGFDILFTSSDGTTKLDHEIEVYTSGTGKLAAWVRVPSLPTASNTDLYMYYGYSSASNQQNATGVWTNFDGVWHLNDNPAGTAPQMKDATSNARNGTTIGSIPAGASVAGLAGNCLQLNGSTQGVNTASFAVSATFTLEGWAKLSALNNNTWHTIVQGGGSSAYRDLTVNKNPAGVTSVDFYDASNDNYFNTAIATGTWYHVAATFGSSTLTAYINGNSLGTVTKSYAASSGQVSMGYSIGLGTDYLNGSLEEVRVSNVTRSAGWILTEYNNISSPSTFCAVGTQETNPLPVELVSFVVRYSSDLRTAVLEWKTVTEKNNYGFEVQRRADGSADYTTLPSSFIPGHGTTLFPQSYSFVDSTVPGSTCFYRLKQIDLDGAVHFHEPFAVGRGSLSGGMGIPAGWVLEQNYPNPFNPSTTFRYTLPRASHVSVDLLNILGERVRELVNASQSAGNYSVTMDATGLPSGTYIYRLKTDQAARTRTMLLVR